MSVKKEDLKLYQSKSLEEKIEMSKERIRIWYEYWDGNVFVSFSGGKDSTVLLDLVRSIYPEVKGMFLDTGLEWPEIRQFVKQFDNIDWVRPKMPFHKVIDKYGYPIISKDVAQKLYEIRTTKSDKLLNKRDEFIAERIVETLNHGEKGILFIGAYHNIKTKLLEKFRIIEIKDVNRVREYQRLLPIYNKYPEQFQEVSKYLASSVKV